jgi:hypothetical protein
MEINTRRSQGLTKSDKQKNNLHLLALFLIVIAQHSHDQCTHDFRAPLARNVPRRALPGNILSRPPQFRPRKAAASARFPLCLVRLQSMKRLFGLGIRPIPQGLDLYGASPHSFRRVMKAP